MSLRAATHPDTGEQIIARATDALQSELDDLEKSPCKHSRVDIRSVITAGGSRQIWKLCLDCGQKFESAMSSKKFNILPDVIDGEALKKTYYRSRALERYGIISRHFIEQENEKKTGKRNYAIEWGKYLQSTEWKEKRERVLKRANFVCEGCGFRPASEVHHLTYDRRFIEMLFDLVALCPTCHSLVHFDKNEKLRSTPLDPMEMRCNGCRYQETQHNRMWCGVYDMVATAALKSEKHCNNGSNGYEGLSVCPETY